jgi:hypothetical protein
MIRTTAAAVLAAATLATAVLATALPAVADTAKAKPECRRFVVEDPAPGALAPRLARLCVRLVEAKDSPRGLSDGETAAATLLGRYLAIVAELELRRGVAGLARSIRSGGTSETSRYLIADRMGLIDLADNLAPANPRITELR